MTKIKIDPKKKLFYWGPADGRPVFPDFWNLGTFIFSRIYKPGWPSNIIFYEKEKLVFVCDHKKLAEIVDEDISIVDRILEKTRANGEELNAFSERFIRDDLRKYPNKKIVACLEKHLEYNSLEYAWGILVPVLDFQNTQYVGDNLKTILERNLSKVEAKRAFFVFTQPLEDSFALEQEKSILRLYKNFQKRLLKKEAEIVLESLKKNHSTVYRQLKAHVKKYAWIFYVYSGPSATEKDFIETLKFFAKKKMNAAKKLHARETERKKLLKEREYFFEKMNLSGREKKTVELAAKVVHLKPRRKDYQSKSYYHLEFLQREIGRRLHLSLNQIRSCTFREIKTALQGGKIDVYTINERMRFHIIVPEGKNIKIYAGAKAKKFNRNIQKEKMKVKQADQIIGQTAFPGKARGVVKRIDMPEDMVKMKEGDILVSTATTPSIVPAIRKAAAIVTDEGGLTCHAAIIARELGIPAVIGTKVATKVLKDGDLIEVRANHGVVKILKRKA